MGILFWWYHMQVIYMIHDICMIYDTIYNDISDVYHMQMVKLLINTKEGLSFQTWSKGLRMDLTNYLPPKIGQKILGQVLSDSLSVLVVRFCCLMYNVEIENIKNWPTFPRFIISVHIVSLCCDISSPLYWQSRAIIMQFVQSRKQRN